MRLKSSNSDTTLEFAERKDDYFRVSIVARDHSAVRQVYAYTDGPALATLFSEAAREWKGWTEPKTWESIEGELRLTLTHDSKGHVTLKVELSSDPVGADCWHHEAELGLDAGQLEAIARELSEFWA